MLARVGDSRCWPAAVVLGQASPRAGRADRHQRASWSRWTAAAACCRPARSPSTAGTSWRSTRRRRSPRPIAPTETIDAGGAVVMPGLINTHTHAPMVLYRGLADDLALMDWLQKYIFPAEAKTVTPAFVRAGTRLAALEMIRSGTTTYADMYYFEEEIARATKAAGLRARARPDHHPVPGRGREDPGGRAGAHRAVHQGVRRRRSDRAGGRAARDVYARRRHAEGRRGSSPIASACR